MLSLARELTMGDLSKAQKLCQEAEQLSAAIAFEEGRHGSRLVMALVRCEEKRCNDATAILESLPNDEESADLAFVRAQISHWFADIEGATAHARVALKLYAASGEDAWCARAWALVGHVQMRNGEYSISLKSYRKARLLAEGANDGWVLASILEVLGWVIYQRGDLHDAFTTISESVETAERFNNAHAAAMGRYHLACMRVDFGDYPAALKGFEEALDTARSAGNFVAETLALAGIGSVYRKLMDDEQALRYFTMSRDVAHAASYLYGEAIALNSLGNVYLGQNDPERALASYSECLRLATEIRIRSFEGDILQNIAGLYSSRGDYDEALDYFARSMEVQRELGSPMGIASVHLRQGRLYLTRGDYDRAIEELEFGLEGTREAGGRTYLLEGFQDISEAYQHRNKPGDLEKAFSNYREYTNLHDELMGHEKQRELAQIRIREEIADAEKERENLRRENERLHLDMKQKMEELNTMALRLLQKTELVKSLQDQLANLPEIESTDLAPMIAGIEKELQAHAANEAEWKAFEEGMDKLHHGFITELSRSYPALSTSELKVCSLLRTRLSTKEIAGLLNVSTRAVEKHRYQIRAKLGLIEGENLTTHLVGIITNY